MKCQACGKELNKKETLYSEAKEPYCFNPFTCNANHPNSVQNIVDRGGAVKLYTESEFHNNMFDNLNVTDEMKERVMRVATKPQSIRLNKIDIALYLLKLQDVKSLSSISEAVRYCIHKAMEVEPITELTDEVYEEEKPVIKIQVPENDNDDEEFTF